MSLALAPERVQRLLDYIALLAKWNRVYSLTAIRAPARMVTHHLLDSLAILPLIEGARIADVGSGAGLPGIPLAIARPGLEVTLIESSQKKAAFLVQAKAELGLANVTVERRRVEAWVPHIPFDGVVSRAFAALPEFLRLAGHLVRSGGQVLAMKGEYPVEELGGIPPGYRLERVAALGVPGLEAARHVVLLRKEAGPGA
ncbi:MAG: ribosomal RNA small subunit methyltransferase G [Burkholderiales bacterium]|nr:MAG: ribosomal RNA small subunit methyltransferase G [Burkholderiales bacterium]